jgi:8-oxo-dGTP pyrophosphatase MutT (NUDIX family)
MAFPVHKVTCFITRTGSQSIELLLFNHPNVGEQIPAGTVNPGENPEIAARREAAEESWLDNLTFLRSLGEVEDPLQHGYHVVTHPSPVYSRPEINSFDWAYFRTGLPVQVLKHGAGFTQVRYEETDRYIDTRYVTYNITGWVPDEALTDQRFRHFYLLEASGETPQQWSFTTDNHIFELF